MYLPPPLFSLSLTAAPPPALLLLSYRKQPSRSGCFPLPERLLPPKKSPGGLPELHNIHSRNHPPLQKTAERRNPHRSSDERTFPDTLPEAAAQADCNDTPQPAIRSLFRSLSPPMSQHRFPQTDILPVLPYRSPQGRGLRQQLQSIFS